MTPLLTDDFLNITSATAGEGDLTESDQTQGGDTVSAEEWNRWAREAEAADWEQFRHEQEFLDAFDNGEVGEDEIDTNAYLLLQRRGRI